MKKRKSNKEKKLPLSSFLKKEESIVLGFLILTLIFRLIFLLETKGIDPIIAGSDMRTYHNYAIQIINGTFPKEPYYYSPLYPYFVSLIYLIFGINPLAVRIIQALIGIFICFLIYLIAKKIFKEKIAFIALFLSIIYGPFMVYEGYLLIEILSTFLITLSIFFLLRQNIVLAGVSLGLSALTRANILIFLPFVFIWMMLSKQVNKKVVKFSLLCLIVFITILPVTIRNYLVSGKFVLISTNGPVNFWMGNNQYANGQYYVPTLPFQILHAEKVQEKVKKKGNMAYLEDVLSFIREEPISYIKLQLKKFFLFWGTDEITNNISYEWVKSISSTLRLPFIIGFGIIAPLGLTGIAFSLKMKFGVELLVLFLLGYSLATIIFFVLSRYSLPIAPFLIIFSAFSISYIYESLKKKDVKITLVFLITLFSFICLLNINKGIALIYPSLFPNGVNLETEDGLWIKDTSDIPRLTKAPCLLSSPKVSLKKELIINKDPNLFKEAILFIDASIIPRKGAMLLLKVNERATFYSDISDKIHPKEEFITTRISLPLEGKFLKEGKNVFELSVTENGWLSVSTDGSFCYKRSFFKDSPNEKWKEIDGEYQISLWLGKT